MASADIIFDERNVPISKQFDDPYFSFSDGLAESRYVFLGGNELPERFQDGFQIAEIGFGTGLNFLATHQAWQGAGQLKFTSFEAFPMGRDDREKSLAHFDEISDIAKEFLAGFDGHHFENDRIKLDVIIGDANETLPQWKGAADAWFLDGFSPAKNPDAWQPELMQEVAAHTNIGGTAATFTAAGHIRRALDNAGFDVQRKKGFGHKRHMTIAKLR